MSNLLLSNSFQKIGESRNEMRDTVFRFTTALDYGTAIAEEHRES